MERFFFKAVFFHFYTETYRIVQLWPTLASSGQLWLTLASPGQLALRYIFFDASAQKQQISVAQTEVKRTEKPGRKIAPRAKNALDIDGGVDYCPALAANMKLIY